MALVSGVIGSTLRDAACSLDDLKDRAKIEFKTRKPKQNKRVYEQGQGVSLESETRPSGRRALLAPSECFAREIIEMKGGKTNETE